MANLMDLLQGQLSEGLVDQLTQQLGGADKQQTQKAASGIMTTLMGALAKNASTPEGANSLTNALDRDHDGGILDDLTGLLSGQSKPTNERTMNGGGILKHLLGNRQSGAIDMISKMSGLDSGKTGNLMMTLAPMIMGMLGKQKRERGLDASGIASLLQGDVKNQANQNPLMGMVTSFLDEDGDGSIVDDLANKGLRSLLGGLFGKRRR